MLPLVMLTKTLWSSQPLKNRWGSSPSGAWGEIPDDHVVDIAVVDIHVEALELFAVPVSAGGGLGEEVHVA